MRRFATLQSAHASSAQAGIVMTQATMIFPPTPHRTAERRFEAPTPMIVEEIIWVVESGSPQRDATSIIVAADASAAKPWIGLRFTSFTPSVFIILHPNSGPSPWL
jgi:hypothetical protein